MLQNSRFYIAVMVLLLAAVVSAYAAHRPIPVVVATNLEKIPMEIGGYLGTEDAFSDAVYKELNADKHVYRHYVNGEGSKIDLYIGYYGTAKGGRTPHNPYACLPGAGAAIVESGTVMIRNSEATPVPVNYILSRQDGVNTVMLHWYQTSGKTVASTGYKQNVDRFLGRTIHNRGDGAFVRVTTSTAEGEVANARHGVERFAQKVLKLLPTYWPVEE